MIDGAAHDVDCSALLEKGIRAVQWYNDVGEVEYVGHHKPNHEIRDMIAYQQFIHQATPKPTFFDDSENALKRAIEAREADPATRLGHFNAVGLPVVPKEITNDN
jgi:hypothetical protein